MPAHREQVPDTKLSTGHRAAALSDISRSASVSLYPAKAIKTTIAHCTSLETCSLATRHYNSCSPLKPAAVSIPNLMGHGGVLRRKAWTGSGLQLWQGLMPRQQRAVTTAADGVGEQRAS
eukprot:6174611-Pleurochrysis_carterae.AAC.1